MATSNKSKNSSGRSLPEHEWFIVLVLRSELLRRVAMAAVIVCFAFGPPQAGAGTAWLQKAKLTASDGAALDYFGVSVSISGNYVIIGAYEDDDRGYNSGSAYIFMRDGAGWVQQKLTASDGAAYGYFGRSVSVSGDYAIVGAMDGNGNVTDSGSAYIFKRDGESWSQQQKITASDGAAGDYFGLSVSISGNYAIVGAFGDDDKGDHSGSAYIFRWDGDGWIQQQKLTASDGAASDFFGSSVSISGDYAIIGASYDDDRGTDSGSAYIFWWDGTKWAQEQKLTAADGAAGDQFGESVSISGDLAIVGAYYDDDNGNDSGSAYIFRRDGIGWVQQQKLTASDGAADDCFGFSVSISGDYAIIGAYQYYSGGTGKVYIFRWNGTGWIQQQKLLASDGAAHDLFGGSVSISSDYAIIGAGCDDDEGADSGSAYVFERICPTADLSSDCCVNFVDFAILGGQWLQTPGVPSADIAPEGGDGVVNSLDLDILVSEWLQCN
jgi:hypothetical protein